MSAQRRGIRALEQRVRRIAAYPGIGAHQGERADRGLDDAAQTVIDPHAVEPGLGSRAGRLAGDRLGQGKLVTVGLADPHEVVRGAEIELTSPLSLQMWRRACLTLCRGRADLRLAIGAAPV